jgi:hypothetical protein
VSTRARFAACGAGRRVGLNRVKAARRATFERCMAVKFPRPGGGSWLEHPLVPGTRGVPASRPLVAGRSTRTRESAKSRSRVPATRESPLASGAGAGSAGSREAPRSGVQSGHTKARSWAPVTRESPLASAGAREAPRPLVGVQSGPSCEGLSLTSLKPKPCPALNTESAATTNKTNHDHRDNTHDDNDSCGTQERKATEMTA